LVNIDVKSWKNPYKNTKICDITVMNPPFGTKVEGIDVAFLEKAICNRFNFFKE
jgi:predicted RNA methylase